MTIVVSYGDDEDMLKKSKGGREQKTKKDVVGSKETKSRWMPYICLQAEFELRSVHDCAGLAGHRSTVIGSRASIPLAHIPRDILPLPNNTLL